MRALTDPLLDGFIASAKSSAPQRLDESLLHSIAAGDKCAMRVLFQRHNVRVYRFVLRIVGNASLAEDVVSEVFFEAWRSAGRFKAKSEVTTWLLAIARHRAFSALRRRSDAQLDDHTAAAIADPSDDPETTLDQKDRSKIIQKCLTQLSPSHREIIDLVYYHGKMVKEVAQIVGVPEGTVKTRMFYARSHMSKLLAAAGIREAC